MSDLLRDKRATRGLRMDDLVGEAADEDETFWGHDTWAEGSDDDEFSEEEIKPDLFDSDFNDTESDSDSDDDSEEEGTKKAEKKAKTKASSASNKYKEPGAIKPKSKHVSTSQDISSIVTASTPRIKRSSSNVSLGSTDTPRSRRSSTMEKTDHAESERKRLQTMSDTKKRIRPVQPAIKHTFTQRDLLMDALETEEKNLQWLSGQRFTDDGRGDDKVVKKSRTHDCVRKLSRRGTYDTITFTNVDAMPSVFNL